MRKAVKMYESILGMCYGAHNISAIKEGNMNIINKDRKYNSEILLFPR